MSTGRIKCAPECVGVIANVIVIQLLLWMSSWEKVTEVFEASRVNSVCGLDQKGIEETGWIDQVARLVLNVPIPMIPGLPGVGLSKPVLAVDRPRLYDHKPLTVTRRFLSHLYYNSSEITILLSRPLRSHIKTYTSKSSYFGNASKQFSRRYLIFKKFSENFRKCSEIIGIFADVMGTTPTTVFGNVHRS